MPVMKALNIDGTTYTTTGEVTVTQTLASGTEIGSINVDGTSTKLYAPTGGGGGGASGLFVTITTSGNYKVMDKTAQEIKDCLDSGIIPVFYDTSEDYYRTMTLYRYTGSDCYITISGISYDFSSTMAGYPEVTTGGGGGND